MSQILENPRGGCVLAGINSVLGALDKVCPILMRDQAAVCRHRQRNRDSQDINHPALSAVCRFPQVICWKKKWYLAGRIS